MCTNKLFSYRRKKLPNGSTATTSMNSEQLLRSNEGSKGKDNSNEIVRNV